MSIRKRIIEYLRYKQISKYKFYKETGISNGFLDKDGAIGSDKCEIICSQYTDLNPEWLFLGTGKMLKPSSTSLPCLEKIRFSPSDDPSLKMLIEKIIELTTENTILKAENTQLKKISKKKLPLAYKTPEEDNNIAGNVAAEPKE
ncbi:MAG: hypothetical protein PHH37_02915 [Paludibacter sp.]|nr:hypothetical protein [Paludibacter sp.]